MAKPKSEKDMQNRQKIAKKETENLDQKRYVIFIDNQETGNGGLTNGNMVLRSGKN